MKKIIQHAYLFYSLLFVIVALIVFGPHLIGGGTLIWSGDGISQHYPALVQFHHDLQQFLFHGQTPALWQWKIGVGQDYIQTFSYYLLGDPFVYPCVFFPESFLPDYYSIMIIMRLYCAGIAFIFAAQRLISASNFALSLSAIVYLFTGYTAYSTFSHPFFLNPLILFPLLILTLKRALQNKSLLPFIAIVAITILVNFYFAYILAAGAIGYWLIELFGHPAYRKWQRVLKIILGAITGFLIGAILFVPSLYFLMNSARTGGQIANGLKLYPFAYYLSLPGTMLVPRVTSEFWLRGGFMTLGLLGVLYIWRRYHKYRTLAITFTIAAIGILLPGFSGVLNGFSSPSNRWLLLCQLPMGLAAIILLDHYSHLVKRDFWLFVVFGGMICISLLLTSDFGHYQGDLGMLVFQYLAVVTLFLLDQRFEFKIKPVLTILTLLNAATVFLSIQPYNVGATNKLLSKTAVLDLVARQRDYPKENSADYNFEPQKQQHSPTAFSRAYIDTQLPNYTYHPSLPILSPLNSFETYWSLENNDLYQFMHQLGVSNSIKNDVTGNGDLRNILLNYLGVSELWLNQGSSIVPASYHSYDPNFYNSQQSYVSDSAFPLFYFPEHLISNQTFAKMSPSQKEASLLDSVAVANGREQSPMAKKVKNIPFYNQTLRYQDGQNVKFATQTPEQLKLQAPSGQVVLLLPKTPQLKDQELHLEFSQIQYQPFNFGELWQADLDDYAAEHDNDNLKGLDDFKSYAPLTYKYRWLARNYLKIGRTTPGYELSAKYLDRTNSFKQLSRKRLSGYEYRQQVTLNLGPADRFDQEQWILLNTDTLAHFAFNLKLVAVPTGEAINQATKQIRQTSDDYLQFKMGPDQIDLTVKRPVKKVVATTIPYSPGWHVDQGKIVKVNGAFIGIALAKGQRHYHLSYRTPWLNVAVIMTVTGFGLNVIWGFYEWRKRKKVVLIDMLKLLQSIY